MLTSYIAMLRIDPRGFVIHHDLWQSFIEPFSTLQKNQPTSQNNQKYFDVRYVLYHILFLHFRSADNNNNNERCVTSLAMVSLWSDQLRLYFDWYESYQTLINIKVTFREFLKSLVLIKGVGIPRQKLKMV